MSEWILASEYAKKRGISPEAVYMAIKRGKLESKKEQGSRYVLVDENAQPTRQGQIRQAELHRKIDQLETLLELKERHITDLKAHIDRMDRQNDIVVESLQKQITWLEEENRKLKGAD